MAAKTGRTRKPARVAIDTDLTIYHAAELKQQMLDLLEQAETVELDLGAVGEVDTAGIQLLMMMKLESQRIGREVRIVAHSPAVQELIDFYNVAGFLGDPLVIPANTQ